MSKLFGQVSRVKAVSILLGACMAIKVTESFTGVDMGWVNPLFAASIGCWFTAVNVKKGGIGEDEEKK